MSRLCCVCKHAEYHGLPPEGAPEWYACTVSMWCAKHHRHVSRLKTCDDHEQGVPREVRDDVDW